MRISPRVMCSAYASTHFFSHSLWLRFFLLFRSSKLMFNLIQKFKTIQHMPHEGRKISPSVAFSSKCSLPNASNCIASNRSVNRFNYSWMLMRLLRSITELFFLCLKKKVFERWSINFRSSIWSWYELECNTIWSIDINSTLKNCIKFGMHEKEIVNTFLFMVIFILGTLLIVTSMQYYRVTI